jgi:hypothetical protein
MGWLSGAYEVVSMLYVRDCIIDEILKNNNATLI